MSIIVSYHDCPKAEGKLEIFPESRHGRIASITIIGDPPGLRYLARVLDYIADFDQEQRGEPSGARAHLHLHPEGQLGAHSCETEICRADASHTGGLPAFMKD